MEGAKQLMAYLAFYKGGRTISDRVIQYVTRSCFSHVEFMLERPFAADHDQPVGLAMSSSGRDGGVREKHIAFHPERWEIVDVPWAPDNVSETFEQEMGKPYDFMGLLGSQLLNLRRHNPEKWFCSEICAAALGFTVPNEYSPGGLYRKVQEHNKIYAKGLHDGRSVRN